MQKHFKTARNKQLHMSQRALILYFSLLERFIAAGEPTTLYLTTSQLSELTGLADFEVCLGRIELMLAGCLHPVNFSPNSIKNAYRFTCINLKQYTDELTSYPLSAGDTPSIAAAPVAEL